MKDTEKNHIDEWLVKQIKQGINTIESVIFQAELVKKYLKGTETI